MRIPVFNFRFIVSIFTVILAILVFPVIRFGSVPDRIDYSMNVPHNSGILAAVSERGELYERQFASTAGCCDRDPARDFNTLESARNSWPQGIWSDGRTMWVADNGVEKLYAYDLATTARYPGKDFDSLKAAGNENPVGIWSDGRTMWVVDRNFEKLYAYEMMTTAREPNNDFDTLYDARNTSPVGIWSDGRTMWVADDWRAGLYAYNVTTTARDPGKDFNTLQVAGNSDPGGIWSDGTTMWVADSQDDKLYAYDMNTTARVPDNDFDTLDAAGNNDPVGIWSDGTTMWVADRRDEKLYAYNMPSRSHSPDAFADFDDDGTVGFSDFLLFATKFGRRQGDPAYDVGFDLDGDGNIGFSDFLVFARDFGKDVSSPRAVGPDLVVEAAEVRDDALTASESFTLHVTVRNLGNGQADSTTLRFYRSWDATISRSDSRVGTQGVTGLTVFGAFEASVTLTQPPGAGLHYYGACVEPVAGESNVGNNCSNSVAVTVTERDSPAGVSKLYWTDWGTDRIQRANLDGSGIEDLVVGGGLDGPDGLGLDVAGGKIYWTDAGASRIQRANLDGSNVEDLVSGLGIPYGLALDVVGGKMYWSDRQTGRIQRSDLDGANVEDLITTGLVFPGELELDIDGGKMYWTNPGSGKIQRANFDGSYVEDLVASGLGSPTGLALDVSAGKIYWTDRRTDKIQRANLDGSAIEDLVTGGLDKPNGLALDAYGGKIYWADAGTDRIQRASLDGSDVEDLVTSADGLVDPSDVAVGGAVAGSGSGPDLLVETISVDHGNPYAGTYFKLSARIRNQGDGFSDHPTIIYYRSPDEVISTEDARIGTDSVWGIPAFSDADESIHLIAPSEAGTYYYGACVVSVYGESNTANNCSRSVTVTVTSPPPFKIEIVFLGGFRDASHRELFRRAALRWMSHITEDIPDVDFSSNPFDEVDENSGMRIRVDDLVDDLRIFASIGEIDGEGRVLGKARPLLVDRSGGLPKVGLIRIDKDDISPHFEGLLLATMIHEIGHVLGFGTLWKKKNLLRGARDMYFTGPLAIQAFDDLGGRTYAGPKVPVESDASHWRKSVFGSELMTPSSGGGRIVLSAITIQSLADMGYEVDLRRADEYRLPDPAGAKPAAEHALDWGDCISEGPVYVVDEKGRVVDVIDH